MSGELCIVAQKGTVSQTFDGNKELQTDGKINFPYEIDHQKVWVSVKSADVLDTLEAQDFSIRVVAGRCL